MQQVDIYTKIVIASSHNLFCKYVAVLQDSLEEIALQDSSSQARIHGDASYRTTILITATKPKRYMTILLETRSLIILEDIIDLEPKILTDILRGGNIPDKNTSTINSAPGHSALRLWQSVTRCPSQWRDVEGTTSWHTPSTICNTAVYNSRRL